MRERERVSEREGGEGERLCITRQLDREWLKTFRLDFFPNLKKNKKEKKLMVFPKVSFNMMKKFAFVSAKLRIYYSLKAPNRVLTFV